MANAPAWAGSLLRQCFLIRLDLVTVLVISNYVSVICDYVFVTCKYMLVMRLNMVIQNIENVHLLPQYEAPLMTRAWSKVKNEAAHYWHGSKLLAAGVRISSRLQ